jgi:aldose 1-epimerase
MQEIAALSGAQYSIEFGEHRAVVVEMGGGLRSYAVAGQEVIDGYEPEELAPAGAGQVLAPWPNRIRDGRYTWDGHSYQLALSEPANNNAIHGLVRWVPWAATAHAPDAVTLSYELPPSPGYPWRLDLTVTWSVGPDGLRAEHTATNRSATAAPFGLGAHPYVRLPGVAVDETVLTIPGERLISADGRRLPIGAVPVAGTHFDFTTGRRIGGLKLDTTFGPASAGGSAVRLSTAPRGASAAYAAPRSEVDDTVAAVTVWADTGFHWWQVFTADTLAAPRTRRAVAVEPMTCPPDAYRSGKDLITLAPGQTWRAAWGIRPELGDGA